MSNEYETQSRLQNIFIVAKSTYIPTHLQWETDQGRGFATAIILQMRFLFRGLLSFHLNVSFSKRLSPWLRPGVGLEPGLAFRLPCICVGLILLPCIPLQFISRNKPWQTLQKRKKKTKTVRAHVRVNNLTCHLLLHKLTIWVAGLFVEDLSPEHWLGLNRSSTGSREGGRTGLYLTAGCWRCPADSGTTWRREGSADIPCVSAGAVYHNLQITWRIRWTFL